MKLLLPIILALGLAGPALAQDDAEARKAAAAAYLDTEVQQSLLNQILSADGMVSQLAANGLPQDKIGIATEIISEETNSIRTDLRTAMVQGMADNFTLEEIDALTAFYSSPVGSSAIGKLQPYMQQTMQTLAPALRAMQGRIQQRLEAALQP